ncbi:MAG: hypothetical protein BJ554DRAFT_1235 [Olpidium bornovanus]|uniref:Uncharacterized protein n=1 Tax=Olpidium bornovanus TaxID=278681 RepID=A0A8H7ZSN8_9FUNG|nr:MAG: hypothetical protein BJ554DRAFT_1235 [Olpidium bornovanus]
MPKANKSQTLLDRWSLLNQWMEQATQQENCDPLLKELATRISDNVRANQKRVRAKTFRGGAADRHHVFAILKADEVKAHIESSCAPPEDEEAKEQEEEVADPGEFSTDIHQKLKFVRVRCNFPRAASCRSVPPAQVRTSPVPARPFAERAQKAEPDFRA